MNLQRTRRRFLSAAGTTAVAALAGCPGLGDRLGDDSTDSSYDLAVEHDVEAWDDYDPEWEAPADSPLEATFETETLVENLEVPWDVEFAATGEVFVSERVGRISRYEAGDLESVVEPEDVIDHADAVDADSEGDDWWGGGSEGGLLGIALHPNYPDVPVLYAYYTYEADADDGVYRNRLVYYDLDDDAEETVVLDGVPGDANIHNGSRVAFGPRNYLWVTTGDANAEEGALARDGASLAGKVLRLEPDGSAPEDDPGFDDPRIHSVGHRNPQGISWLPDGTPLVTEHGPGARDEVQVLEAGGDYGWPTVRGGPDDGEYESYAAHDDVVNPLVNTGGSTWAPSGCVFYTGDAVPALRNRLLVGGLASERCHAVTVYPRGEAPTFDDGTHYDADWTHPEYDAVSHDLLAGELGRIRHVEQGPDGDLYAVTSNRDGRSDEFPVEGDDRLVRIVQAD